MKQETWQIRFEKYYPKTSILHPEIRLKEIKSFIEKELENQKKEIVEKIEEWGKNQSQYKEMIVDEVLSIINNI